MKHLVRDLLLKIVYPSKAQKYSCNICNDGAGKTKTTTKND